MKLTKEKAKENLYKLIEKFERELTSGRAKEYNEEATKTAFIQPFLEDVLGWDVSNRDEVSPEEKISRGRVDYGLKLENKIKVFVEAKPIKADLNRHIEQAVGYGYNRKDVPFVLLTDFEGIKLFDVTVKPDLRNPLKGLKLDLSWEQYLSQFDKLWVLSKESVLKGELDKLLIVKPKERISVDKAILDDLKKWRESLAKDIFKNNTSLFHSDNLEKDADYLKEITQKLLDRIIFMRFCEDRNFVHGGQLKELFEGRTENVGTQAMLFLKEKMQYYNVVFNSDLFRPQDWETNLAIEFKVMSSIVLDTYNPYQFDVIPLEVLGNIYEQYLGYTIRLTEHQVKYELKPDVRKTGGVYYTPEYIVDYIVKNTIGKLIEEFSAKKIKKLRILDPACGSGSFLIRAYEEMLKYYQSQKKHKKQDERQGNLDFKHEEIAPRLTIHEKSEILRNHIFGVDIDEQAVEVTKLSLMLKMLEGEHGFIPGKAVLPMLDKNILCGNSLISGDVLKLKEYFGEEWYKVKPFNWQKDFEEIVVDEGGFDVVIGNPPYIKTQMLQDSQSESISFYKDFYPSARRGNFDIYILFIERALQLLSRNGLMGFICPHKFFNSNYGVSLRKLISERRNVYRILNFGFNQVFENATTYTCLLFLAKIKNKDFEYYAFRKEVSLEEKLMPSRNDFIIMKSESLSSENWIFTDVLQNKLLARIKSNTYTLETISTNIFQGPKSGADPVFIMQVLEEKGQKCKCLSASATKPFLIERQLIRPYVKGKNIRRYFIQRNSDFIIFPYDQKGSLFSEDILMKSYPLGFQYLQERKDVLLKREEGRFRKFWWSYSRPQNMQILNRKKILTPFNAFKGSFALDAECDFIFSAGVSGAYGILLKEELNFDYRYILGLLNSSLLTKNLMLISTALRGGYYSFENKYIKQLPIHSINGGVEKAINDNIIALVDIILNLNKKLSTVHGSEKEQIQRLIEKTDKEIDELVYKLYGITGEERMIIEETQ